MSELDLVCQPVGDADWDTFVAASPRATLFHTRAWHAVLGDAFGLDTLRQGVSRDGRLLAVLPLAMVRRPLAGKVLMSLPFAVAAGVLGDDADVNGCLEHQALMLGGERGARFVELRSHAPGTLELPSAKRFFTFERALDGDAEVNLRNIPRKQRAVVRKGIKAGLRAEPGPDLDCFYALYAESVRNLGTPVYPRRYFAALLERLGDACQILTVHDGRAPLASVMSFRFRDRIMPYYAGGTALARRAHAYDFLYWSLMCDAAARGARVFDYGRSVAGTGSFAFKKNWGFEPRPLHYRFGGLDGAPVPELTPDNPTYALAIRAWQRLPLAVANRIGPALWPFLA